jgi:CheY-like chemotaxis protein
MKQKKVLDVMYVDDEKELGDIFRDLYSNDLVNVHFFDNSKAAIERSKNSQFDLAFLDYRLPEMLGDEVANHLPKELPKYLITGELEVASKYQFIEIISKPTDFKVIGEIIQSYLDKKNGN